MAIYARLGGYVGLEPNTTTVYHDRPVGSEWEALTVTQRGPEGWFDLDFVAAKKPLRLNRDHTLGTGADHDGWGGQWAVSPDESRAVCDGVVLALEGFVVTKPIHLEQRGNDFVDASGARMVIPAVDAFLAYRQYLDGGAAALVPFVQESQRLGFKAWRVFMQGSKRQNQVMDLSPTESGYYDNLKGFADTLNANGLILLATVYVDNQDVQSPVSHWSDLAARLKGTSTLLSGGNQWSKNGFDPWALSAPAGFIWSRGSDVDDVQTVPNGAPASELHATRVSFDRALMDSTASPPFMRQSGSTMVWMTEGNPFGDSDGYSEAQAWQLGRGYSILWALAVFHNRQSQRGQLMTETTARCGAAWVKGMTL